MTTLNKSKVMGLINKSVQQIDRLIALGMPVISKKPWQFDEKAVVNWIGGYDAGKAEIEAKMKQRNKAAIIAQEDDPIEQEKILKLRAEREMVEHKLSVYKGEHVEWTVAIKEHERRLNVLRARLTSIPSRYSPQIADLKGVQDDIHIFLDIMVREIMEELSDPIDTGDETNE